MEREPAAAALFKILAGFIVQVYGIWFLGLAGFCGRKPILMIYGALSIVLAPSIWGYAQAQAAGWIKWKPSKSIFWMAVLGITALIAMEQIIASHAPAAWRDDLSYHLYLPKAYLEMEKIQPPPLEQRQSYYHQIINMSYLPVMALGGEWAVKCMNIFWWIFLIGAALLIAEKIEIQVPPLILASALAATPGILWLAETAMTDLAVTTFALAGFLATLLFEGSRKPVFLPLSAALSAFALNKYTAWSYFLASLILIVWRNRKNKKTVFTACGTYGFFAFIFLAPLAWYLWKLKGNPVYPIPLLGFPSDPIEQAMQKILHTPVKNPAILAGYLWNNLLGGRQPDACPMIALAPTVFLFPKFWKKNTGILLKWSLFGYSLRFFLVGEGALLFRYILPSYIVWVILAGCAWSQAAGRGLWQSRILKTFFLAGLALPGLARSTARSIAPLQLNLGLTTENAYMESHHPGEGWEMTQFINQMPGPLKIAVLDHHFIPYRYRNLASFFWIVPPALLALDEPDKIRAELKSQGITHVLLIPSRWDATATPTGFRLYGIYFGHHLPCRWWERTPRFSFLNPVYATQKSTLFKLE